MRAKRDSESKILHDIRVALGLEPDLILWRNNTGALRDINGRVVKFGLCEGGSDLIGIGPGGRLFAIEIKKPNHSTSKERAEKQGQFRNLVRAMGGFAFQVCSVDGAVRALSEARRLYGEGKNQADE